MKKIQINLKSIDLKLIVKVLSSFMVIIILINFTLTFFFLYKNFYQAVTHTQKIKILKSEISTVKIDMDLYKQVIKNLEKKQEINLENLLGLKNPFQSTE